MFNLASVLSITCTGIFGLEIRQKQKQNKGANCECLQPLQLYTTSSLFFPGKSMRFSQFVTSQALVMRSASDEWFQPRADETTIKISIFCSPNNQGHIRWPGRAPRRYVRNCRTLYLKHVCTRVNNCEGRYT